MLHSPLRLDVAERSFALDSIEALPFELEETIAVVEMAKDLLQFRDSLLASQPPQLPFVLQLWKPGSETLFERSLMEWH